MEKLDLTTPNFTDENIQKLSELFPNCVTEGADGKAIDFDTLKQELSSNIIEGNKERYQLTWPGKAESLVTANTPINKTLRPAIEESKDFDNTENLYIEGDNLEVLKLLQETYLGKIKMIYIDPPYNTGKDFVYKDNFTQVKAEYDEESGNVDEEGGRLVTNPDSNGRYHSDWLSMMYPRLKLARNLLTDDGVIFVSIGPEEISNLTSLMNEVFGESNYRNSIAIKRGAKSVQAQFQTWDKLGNSFEYLLLYSKSPTYRFPKMERALDKPKGGSWNNHWRGTDRPTMRYEIFGITPETGQWRWGMDRSIKAIENYKKILNDLDIDKKNVTQNDIDLWYKNQELELDLLRLSSNGKPEHYIPPTDSTLLNDVWFHLPSVGGSIVRQLMDGKVFDNPKPLGLIQQACQFCSSDSIVLDFFSGSATTAHAVMQLNAEDSGKRKFIMAQIPEATDEKSEAHKAGYKTIAEIGKERIRRAGEKVITDNTDKEGIDNLDVGFRVLKVDSSNMKDVYFSPDKTNQSDMFNLADNIKADRSDEDLLFMVLLDWGIDLSVKIERREVAGKTVYFADVDNNFLAACFEENLDEDFVKALAAEQSCKVVLRDSGFASSSVKINVEQIFKQADIEVKVI